MSELPAATLDGESPAPRRSRVRRTGTILLLAALAFLGLEAWWISTPAPGVRNGPKVVEIPAHSGFLEIARILSDAEVIPGPVGFTLLTLARRSTRSLKAGEYQIPQGADTLTVLSMVEGGKVLQHPIVFQEGATVGELATRLGAEKLADPDEIVRVARNPQFLKSLDVPGESLEGYLFPDTYQFVKGMTAEEILGRMVARMRERVSPDIIAQARARDLTFHRLLTLASIIEKEAVDRDEMPLISAVFWNRLKIDMPLQADPTVQYAVGKERQRLSRDDLLVESPFNTYRRQGLPPGPIASPGLAAIRAAANPAAVKYLYFVAMDDRRHQFSTSLADHNAAVAKFRGARPR